jgi:hypothetical protein
MQIFMIELDGNTADSSGTFWTSGTNNGCTSTLGWCAVHKMVKNGRWKIGQPGPVRDSLCISVALFSGKLELLTEPCSKTYPYICEVSTSFANTQ